MSIGEEVEGKCAILVCQFWDCECAHCIRYSLLGEVVKTSWIRMPNPGLAAWIVPKDQSDPPWLLNPKKTRLKEARSKHIDTYKSKTPGMKVHKYPSSSSLPFVAPHRAKSLAKTCSSTKLPVGAAGAGGSRGSFRSSPRSSSSEQ